VVVELNAVEAELLVFAELAGEGDFLTDFRAERVAAGADVPGAEGEPVLGLLIGGGHSSFLRGGAIRINMAFLQRRPRPPGTGVPLVGRASHGCGVSRLTISCVACGQKWTVATTFSVYEQQATESCPCPRCGAYALCVQEPADDRTGRPARRPHVVPATAMR